MLKNTHKWRLRRGVLREAEFYELVRENHALESMMPNILAVDKENNVIMMDDLGAHDYGYLYQSGKIIPGSELEGIVDFAAKLHQGFSVGNAPLVIRNREMRKLNHEHIFVFPYLHDNGLNLNDVLPGLQEAARPFKEDKQLRAAVEKLGKRYLSDGQKLLHGDYFPGSWLKTKAGIRIIDPEFCFFGDPEFEIGVLIAHLKMADQPEQLVKKALERYTAQTTLDKVLCEKFTAIEILRRIMGLAQLPLEIDLEKRKALLIQAREKLLK